MTHTQWFDSPYYHLLNANSNQPVATDFINSLADYLKPAPLSTILQAGCGNGFNALHLAEKGLDVTGIDFSFAAINEAKKQERDWLTFYQHDVRQPFWINYFDYVLNLFSSFGYYRTRRENDAAIRTISQSLNDKGTLVIDYLNVHYDEDHLVSTTEYDIDGHHFTVTNTMDDDFFYKKIEVNHSSFTEPAIFTAQKAKFSLGDFTDMLAYQGMQIREVFGDYRFGNYHVRKTPRMIILAKRIK